MKLLKRNFFLFFLSIILIICSLGINYYSTKAETLPYYLTSSVLTDLNDGDSNITEEELISYYSIKYPDLVTSGDIKLVKFIEYGLGTSHFGLYVIIWNPNGLNNPIIDSKDNCIQIGFSEDKTTVLQSSYVQYNLKFVNASKNHVFIKYRIENFSPSYSTNRFYCISGIQLFTRGKLNATEYRVSTIYHCTSENGFTTTSTDNLEFLEVGVNHTFYRTNYSKKPGFVNQLSSCYFSLPEMYSGEDAKYGYLSGILAKFYNYVSKYMLITCDNKFYTGLHDYIGVDLNTTPVELELQFGNYSDIALGTRHYYYTCINRSVSSCSCTGDPVDEFYWLLFDKNKSLSYDYIEDGLEFPGKDLELYFENWVNKYISSGMSFDEARNKSIEDLFISETEYLNEEYPYNLLGLTYGENKVKYSNLVDNPDITDDDDTIRDLTFNANRNFIVSLFKGETDEITLSPIVIVNPEDAYGEFALSDSDFSEKYYIDITEVPSLKKYCEDQSFFGKDTYIFRYDVCEYLCQIGYGFSVIPEASSYVANRVAIAQESVYLDFEILSFDFTQENVTYTIPNIMSPDNVFPNLTYPSSSIGCSDSCLNGLRTIFAILLFILALIILNKTGILPYIVKGVWWIIKSPFLLIKKIIDTAKKNSAKREVKKKEKVKKLEEKKSRQATDIKLAQLKAENKALKEKKKELKKSLRKNVRKKEKKNEVKKEE